MNTRQSQVLRSIATYVDEHGHAPSMRDIQDRVGLASSSQSAYWVSQLVQEGLLMACTKCPHATTRTLTITDYGRAMLKVGA